MALCSMFRNFVVMRSWFYDAAQSHFGGGQQMMMIMMMMQRCDDKRII